MKIKENGNIKKAFIRTTVIAAIIFTLITMILPASASDWPQFQKDNINTGNTTDIGPIYDPTAVWYKQTSGTGMGGIDVNPIVADDQVFVIDYQAVVWAFNKTTGEENWHTSCSTPGTFELSTPAYHNGMLYAATSAGAAGQGYCKVTALYAINGTKRESITLQTSHGYQLNTPITYSDNKIYLGDWNGTVTSTDGTGTYYCLNASNVTHKIWEYKATGRKTGYYWAGAAIVGNYIIFGDDTANVTCLNKNTGALVDYFNVSQQCGCSNPVERIRSSILWVDSTDHIYFTAMYRDNAHGGYGTGHLYAVPFNSNTGDLGGNSAIGGGSCKWNYDLWNSKSTPVYYDGRLYVGGGYRMYQLNHTGKMCCINETDGSLIWEWTSSAGRVKASPALSVVNGRKFIYFATNVYNSSAYCLEDMGDDYDIRWIWNPSGDDQYVLHGMAISDGFIYYGTDKGILHALQDHFEIHIWKNNSDPKNLIAVPLKSTKTTLVEVIGNNAGILDTVYIYNNTNGYAGSTYFGGPTGWTQPHNVEPIIPSIGYEYQRNGGGEFSFTNTGYLLKDIISTPIYGKLSTGDPRNLIGYAAVDDSTLSETFDNHPGYLDTIYRYENGYGYQGATYFGGWVGADNVNPIEPCFAYEYDRVHQTFNWGYDPYNI